MSQQRIVASHATIERQPKRDFELCKVVFGAAISQILYVRRAFPPECFRQVPLEQVVSRSFEDIVTSPSDFHLHDKELLRDQGNTLFLRQEINYGLQRFLGILREDIFPLIESEGLVKFRISFLRAKAWAANALVEYYTVAVKYEPDGRYELDIWRAGTGKQHIAKTDSQLWNLGDFLSRLPSVTEPLHFTLAFHATERPDNPPIGLWKFDRTDFDDANLDLQQRGGYSYARIARLEIMPIPLTESEEVIFETSPDPEPELLVHEKPKAQISSISVPRQTQESQKSTQKSKSKTARKRSEPRRRDAAATRLSPPQTLGSSRNTSHATTAKEAKAEVPADSTNNRIAKVATPNRSSGTRKGVVTRRKPKRPLQLFETAASSLPPTQIIGESQTLSHIPQVHSGDGDVRLGIGSTGQLMLATEVPRSPSPDLFTLLDGISLSPDALSAIHTSPRIGLPVLPAPFPATQQQGQQVDTRDEFRGLLRLGPSSSVLGNQGGIRQWEPRASPPAKSLDVPISDDQENVETASEAEDVSRPPIDDVHMGITYDFEPNTVARRTSLFYDLPSSSGGEE